jgi:DDE superfamily endonuclease
MAAARLGWAKGWVGRRFEQSWVVVDGGYAKKPSLQGAKALGFTVVSRLRKGAALRSVPGPVEPGQERHEGRPRIHGKERISLAKRAGQKRGWQRVECEPYGREVTKTIKTFLATWKPAGGVIRVVLVLEGDGEWLPSFRTNPEATVVELLEGMAGRGSHEQMNKDVKEVRGAGQQQVRDAFSSEGCFNLSLWMYSLVGGWAWGKEGEDLVGRSDSPWDYEPRRPSHADKRKALQRQVLRGEIEEALSRRPSEGQIRALVGRLLGLAV